MDSKMCLLYFCVLGTMLLTGFREVLNPTIYTNHAHPAYNPPPHTHTSIIHVTRLFTLSGLHSYELLFEKVS